MSVSGSISGEQRASMASLKRAQKEAEVPQVPKEGIAVTEKGMKVPEPKMFSGKQGTLHGFLRSVDIYMSFHSDQFWSAKARNLFLLSYLKGDAADALQPQLEEYVRIQDPDAMEDESLEFLTNKKYVRNMLMLLFKDSTEIFRLERRLYTLNQTGPATEYTAKFRGITCQLDWNLSAQMAQYRQGLKSHIKDELARVDPVEIEEFPDLIAMVHSLDNRLYERKMEQKYLDPARKLRKKENVSATSSKPHKKGKKVKKSKKDLSNVECYSCGKKGHYKNKCPKGNYQAAVTGDRTLDNDEWSDLYRLESIERDLGGHISLSWTACYNNQCKVHLSEKQGLGWFPSKRSQQVAMASSEEYHSEDNIYADPPSSEEGDVLDGEPVVGLRQLRQQYREVASIQQQTNIQLRERLAETELVVEDLTSRLTDRQAEIREKRKETLVGEECKDATNVVHHRIPRGSRFLKDGGVLLPDLQIVSFTQRREVLRLAREIANIPPIAEPIPEERFVGTSYVESLTTDLPKLDLKN